MRKALIGGSVFASILAIVFSLSISSAGADAKKCPVSGGPAKAEHSLHVNGTAVNFCCAKCPEKDAKKLGVNDEDVTELIAKYSGGR